MKASSGLILSMASWFCAPVSADLPLQELLIQKNQVVEAYEESYRHQAVELAPLLPSGCFKNGLPRPLRPVFNLRVADSAAGTVMQLRFWRQPCTDTAGIALLMRAIPNRAGAFLCGLSMTIVQNGIQHNNLRLLQNSGDSNSWCGNLFSATTFIVDESSLIGRPFVPRRALEIVFQDLGGVAHSIKLPTFR